MPIHKVQASKIERTQRPINNSDYESTFDATVATRKTKSSK